jgi:hypothetical protein
MKILKFSYLNLNNGEVVQEKWVVILVDILQKNKATAIGFILKYIL